VALCVCVCGPYVCDVLVVSVSGCDERHEDPKKERSSTGKKGVGKDRRTRNKAASQRKIVEEVGGDDDVWACDDEGSSRWVDSLGRACAAVVQLYFSSRGQWASGGVGWKGHWWGARCVCVCGGGHQ
jgi:hypothetical protein